MSPRVRRRSSYAVLLAACVLLLWRCTGALDRSEPVDAINVFGPWLSDDADAFAASLEGFTEATGIEVNYTGSSDFDSDLRARLTSGTGPPDIAMVPQPGIVAELLARDLIVPFSDGTVDAIIDNYPLTREQLDVSGDGNAYIVPYRAVLKSLVWYRPDVFAEQGWVVPETLDELTAFAEELAQTDVAPWCFTIDSGASTGWAATDWVEDLVLRRAGPEVYDEWVSGERGFDDDQIRAAFEEFDSLVLEPGHTVGGTQRILSVSVAAASDPLFAEEPGCAMYKQANFATAWFPEATTVGPDGDVDFFVLPGVSRTEPAPLLRGGDGAIQFSDRSEVSQLMTYLVSPEGGRAWAEQGGYFSIRDSVPIDEYGQTDQLFAEVLREGRVDRFDASDSFPSDLRDTLLDAITRYVEETSFLDNAPNLDNLVDAVDAVDARRAEE